MQLNPIVQCPKAKMARYEVSLMERLVAAGNVPIMLKVQYRMHPAIIDFPN